MVRHLLQEGADLNESHELWKNSALRYAILSGNSRIVGLLLEAGANASTYHVDGYTALILASARGSSHMVSLLLAAGAEVDAVIRNFGYYYNHDYKMSSLMFAARANNAQIVHLLLEAGANPHLMDYYDDRTALDLARLSGNTESIALLEAAMEE